MCIYYIIVFKEHTSDISVDVCDLLYSPLHLSKASYYIDAQIFLILFNS